MAFRLKNLFPSFTLNFSVTKTNVSRQRISVMTYMAQVSNGLTSPHVCACPKPRPEFPVSNVVFMFIEAIDRFVFLILVESFDLHCLNFLFIIQLHYLTRKRFKHTQQIYKTSQYYFKYSNNNSKWRRMTYDIIINKVQTCTCM